MALRHNHNKSPRVFREKNDSALNGGNRVFRLIIRYEVFWSKSKRNGVTIEIAGFPPIDCFISDKQLWSIAKSLEAGSAIAVFEGDRFIWCGNRSDIDYLSSHFHVNPETLNDEDPHYKSLLKPEVIEHDELKN